LAFLNVTTIFDSKSQQIAGAEALAKISGADGAASLLPS
jgi:hypothetical protein